MPAVSSQLPPSNSRPSSSHSASSGSNPEQVQQQESHLSADTIRPSSRTEERHPTLYRAGGSTATRVRRDVANVRGLLQEQQSTLANVQHLLQQQSIANANKQAANQSQLEAMAHQICQSIIRLAGTPSSDTINTHLHTLLSMEEMSSEAQNQHMLRHLTFKSLFSVIEVLYRNVDSIKTKDKPSSVAAKALVRHIKTYGKGEIPDELLIDNKETILKGLSAQEKYYGGLFGPLHKMPKEKDIRGALLETLTDEQKILTGLA